MPVLLVRLSTAIHHLAAHQSGQDAFEYLLVIGGISVAVIVAVATPVGTTMVNGILTGTCKAIATIPNMSSVSC